MDIEWSAEKHGIAEADIWYALDNIVRYREQEYEGEIRIFVIAPARDGRFLELVLVPADEPLRVIHADILRPNHYHFLRER